MKFDDGLIDDDCRLDDTESDDISIHDHSRRFTSVMDNIRSNSFGNSNETHDVNIYTGILEINEGSRYGFLRKVRVTGVEGVDKKLSKVEYLSLLNSKSASDDIYVSSVYIKNYSLRTDDIIECSVNMPNEKGRFKTVNVIKSVNFYSPENCKNRVNFDRLTPIFPNKQIVLSVDSLQFSTRIVDLFTPIGFGQRGMIVAQPKSGKTVLLKDIANGIALNYPDVELIVLLIGERPEEVTDMTRFVKGLVIASTFDDSPKMQVEMSMLALGMAKSSVEHGRNVVILMDSITRLARAYNAITPPSGRILSGGIDANALDYPKKFFGAARNTDNGASLTIIATALVDTGSKMDDVIFEEFKGTGNMELLLNRSLSNRRIFPAIDVLQSGTRNDNLLLKESVWDKVQLLRRFISEKNPMDVIDFLKDKMKHTRNNDEFLNSMNS